MCLAWSGGYGLVLARSYGAHLVMVYCPPSSKEPQLRRTRREQTANWVLGKQLDYGLWTMDYGLLPSKGDPWS